MNSSWVEEAQADNLELYGDEVKCEFQGFVKKESDSLATNKKIELFSYLSHSILLKIDSSRLIIIRQNIFTENITILLNWNGY